MLDATCHLLTLFHTSHVFFIFEASICGHLCYWSHEADGERGADADAKASPCVAHRLLWKVAEKKSGFLKWRIPKATSFNTTNVYKCPMVHEVPVDPAICNKRQLARAAVRSRFWGRSPTQVTMAQQKSSARVLPPRTQLCKW